MEELTWTKAGNTAPYHGCPPFLSSLGYKETVGDGLGEIQGKLTRDSPLYSSNRDVFPLPGKQGDRWEWLAGLRPFGPVRCQLSASSVPGRAWLMFLPHAHLPAGHQCPDLRPAGRAGTVLEVDMEGLEDWEALGVVPGSLPSS